MPRPPACRAKAGTGAALADNTTDKSESFHVRKTTAHVRSERLVLAQLPIDEPIGAGTAEQAQLTLDGMVLNVESGQPVAVNGERDDLPGVTVSEVVLVDHAEHSGGFTTWHFASPGLTYRYVRSTVTINANVVAATHGETVVEVLGSGDAAQPNQRFTLKKPPLTHVPAAGAGGRRQHARAPGRRRALAAGRPALRGRAPTTRPTRCASTTTRAPR